MYASVQEVRDEGVTQEQASDLRIEAAIRRATALIDALTGQWFEARPGIHQFDGPGAPTLFLKVPAVTIEQVKINGEVISASAVMVYGPPQDRCNPRLYYAQGFPKGRRNIEVSGTFGFVEESRDGQGNPVYLTPELIRYACLRLVVKDLAPLADGEAQEERKRVRVISEATDRHSYTLAQDQRFSGFTGDPEVDGILVQFTAPPGMGSV